MNLTDEGWAIVIIIYIHFVINLALMNNMLQSVHRTRCQLTERGMLLQAELLGKVARKDAIYYFFIGWIMKLTEGFKSE